MNSQEVLGIGHLLVVPCNHLFLHFIYVTKRAILHLADEVVPVVLVADDKSIAHKDLSWGVLFQGAPDPLLPTLTRVQQMLSAFQS